MLAAHDMFPRTARLNCNSGLYPVSCVDWYSQFESPRRCVFPVSFSGVYHLPSSRHADRSGAFGDLARYSSTVACCLAPVACRLLEKANGGLHSVCPGGTGGAISGTMAPAYGLRATSAGLHAQRASAKNGGQIERRATSSGNGSDWIYELRMGMGTIDA